MVLFLGLCGLIWGVGHAFGAPKYLRSLTMAGLYGFVLLSLSVLPTDSMLSRIWGESIGIWLVVGGGAVLVTGYISGLKWLKARAMPKHMPSEQDPALFSDAELERYARHIFLREIGGPGQKALKEARVLVIGAGGLGAPVLQYLAGAGIGTIGVIDDDVVDNSNLQRQVIHRDQDIGAPKVFSAKAAMLAQNPYITVRPYHRRLNEDMATDLFADYDVIIDGSDNFETRYLSNRVAASLGKPLISGALSQWEGQVSLFDPAQGTPCYECVFREAPAAHLAPSCAEAGVAGPLPGIIGSIMAMEAVKHVTGAGQTLRGEMLIYDGLWGETRKLGLKRRDCCPVCNATSAA